MKIKLLILLFFGPLLLFSQEPVEKIYGFTKSYNLENLSQDEIHSLIIEWVGQNFNSPSDAIKYDGENKIIVERSFKMSPKIIQTAQNTTSNYKVSSSLNFFISDNNLLLEMHLDDIYSFDGKKGNPKTSWEIINGQISDSYVRILLTKGFMNVKQFGRFLAMEKKGDAMARKAVKYVNKEIKKGVYIKRLKKVSNELNMEIKEVFGSIEEEIYRIK
jgi:hypothetical protein|tara:strand:- start:494 stop:1144 length:651 start_codon:yes stop_codon:yes gene_type:complete